MIRPLLYLPLTALLLGSAPALADDASLEKMSKKLHAAAGGEFCQPLEEAYDAEDAFQSWKIRYPVSWGTEGEEEEITLVRIWCMAGAYNETHAYYVHREYEGVMPLAFAMPAHEAKYEDEDSMDGKLLELKIVGMNASTLLVNSQFDPETKAITSYGLWRGLGDASDAGTWEFDDGRWVLKHFEIDASYDGEVNPEVVVDY